MNNGDPGSVNGYQFTELANGNMAVSWAAAVVKEIAPGQTDGIQDVYARVFNPKTGEFITDEINLTNSLTNEYVTVFIPLATQGLL